MDSIDAQILRELQADARMSMADLSEKIGLSSAPTWRRVKRLEEAGVIAGYHAELNPSMLGLDVTAIVSVRFSSHDVTLADRFAEAVQQMSCVQSCDNVTGDVDYILYVRTKNLAEYERFTKSVRAIPGVTSIQSHISLKQVKRDHHFAVPDTGLPAT